MTYRKQNKPMLPRRLQRCWGRNYSPILVWFQSLKTHWPFLRNQAYSRTAQKAQGGNILGLFTNLRKSDEDNGKKAICSTASEPPWSKTTTQNGRAPRGPRSCCVLVALHRLCVHFGCNHDQLQAAGPHLWGLSFSRTTGLRKVAGHTWESLTQQTLTLHTELAESLTHTAQSVSRNPSSPHVGRRKSGASGI